MGQVENISIAMAPLIKINVVAAVIFNPAQEILIAKRPPTAASGNRWEFPGGKIEQNETPYEALCRELYEELGITVTNALSWMHFDYTYPDRHIFLNMWIVKEFLNEPFGKEGQPIRWVKQKDLKKFSFLEANQKIIRLIQLMPLRMFE